MTRIVDPFAGMDQNERAELEQELDEGARDFEKGEHEEARAFVARLLEKR